MDKAKKKLKKYKRFDYGLMVEVKKQLELFEKSESHPSLRVHKLHGELEGYWSMSVNKSIRIIYYIENGMAYFINIGTHNEVYRMN